MKNDLHLHTNFSACADINNSYQSLLVKCEKSGLNRISITDHNTCLFHVINMFTDTTPLFSGEIIPGMECCAIENGITLDLLAYNFDVIKAFNWAFETYGTLEIRQTKMKNMLMDLAIKNSFKVDSSIRYNGKVEYAHKYVYNNLKMFSENNWIFEKFNICNYSDFYRTSSINKDFPLYIDLQNVWPSISTVVNAIHSMGGIVVLAHPYNYKKNVSADTLLKFALENNVDGIEVYHPSATKEQSAYLLNFAKEHNLKVSGGSDYHALPNKDSVGIINIDNLEEVITV